MKEKASKSINQSNIKATILSNELIRFPESLPEQQRIVGILDEASEGIAAANAKKNFHRRRQESHPADAGHRHGQDLHCLSDRLEALQEPLEPEPSGNAASAHPLPGRPEVFMGMINQQEKTLVFCASQLHALAVRDLVNQMKSSKDPNYCHRVTANDGKLARPRPVRSSCKI